MMTAGEIIEALGGAAKVGKAIKAPITTVHGWKRVGHVPPWRIPDLVTLARKVGQPITASHFPPKPPRKAARSSDVAA